MTALELRLIAYGLAALLLLGGAGWLGYHFTAAHYERVLALRDAAEAKALHDADQRVIAAQQAQSDATQKAETQYASLKSQYDSLSGHLADSVRELTAIHRLVLPTAPGTATQPDAGSSGTGGDTELASLSGQAAEACLHDAATLASLQTWISSLK